MAYYYFQVHNRSIIFILFFRARFFPSVHVMTKAFLNLFKLWSEYSLISRSSKQKEEAGHATDENKAIALM